MKKNIKIARISITFLLTIFFATATLNLYGQSCNQVEILYQPSKCFEKRQGSAGMGGGSACVEIAVCVNQPTTYTSSVSGTGWTLNWTVTGPAPVVINPNNTSSVVNIVWPQVGVYTLTLTATDGAGNVFTYCLKVNVKDKPVSNFTFAPNNVCAGSTISFTNTTTYSGGGVVYSWDFGDPISGANNYSATTHPFHTYNFAGVYTVTLVASSFATSGAGTSPADHPSITTCCSDTITMQVVIIPGSLTIECISTVCAGDTATYTAVGCANPVWLPPVGGIILSQTANTVTIIWGNGNPQGQILALCPGGCIASVSVPIIPSNPIIVGNANPCISSITSYSLPVLPGTIYTWTLTNISTATNYNNLLNTFPDNNTVWINWSPSGAPPGTYLLTINLTNNHICCNSNGSLIINPTQAFKAFSDQTVCTGPTGASLFVLPAAGTFNWSVLAPNAGVSPLTGTGSTFNPVFANTGNYTIQVIETGNNYCNSGIANPQQIQVTVVGTPLPGIINGPAIGCSGSSYSYNMSTNAPSGFHYLWSITGGAGSFQPGNLITATGNSATILWTALSGTISVVLQRNGVPPCPTAPVTKNVIQATVGSISGPLNVCVDGTGSYTLSGGNLPAGEVITWSLAAPFSSMGTIINGQTTNSIIILWHGQPGVGPWGPVTINASTGCGNATPLSGVMVFPKFNFSIVKTGSDICQPGGVTLTVTGAPLGSTYSWTLPGGPGPNTPFLNNIIVAGSYSVTVTKGGCSFTQQYLVEDPFAIAPVACGLGTCSALDSTNQTLGVTILKPLVGPFTYQWYRDTFPTGILIPGATTPNYTTPTHGKFYVVVTYGSCSKILSFNVGKVCCPDVKIPKIVSVIRNTCNSYTFTGVNLYPFGATVTWDFGDGTTAPGDSGFPITHVYTLAGVYCVTYCVGPPSPNLTNCGGNCAATNVTVPIDAGFSYTLGCNGCLSVSNASTVITNNPSFVTYFWNFGDGNTSVAQNPGIHCYAIPGTYVVTLTVTFNDGIVTCTKTATQTVTYSILAISISPTPVCTGNPSTFSSTPGSFISYTWDFGDGFTAYTPSSTHIYNTPGIYVVTLTVVDLLGNTCSDTNNVIVKPGIGPCSILPAFICPGGTALLTTPNIAGFTYLWEVETSPNIFIPAPGVNTNNNYTVTTPGFYRVNITGVNGCGCTTKKVEVKAVPSPKAIISVTPSSKLCGSGDIVLTSVNHLAGHTSDWYANGNYGTLLTSGPMHFEYGVTSTTVYNLVLTNEYGCTDTCSFTVIVNPIPVPPLIISSPTLCEGVPITLTVTNYSNSISWNTGAASTSITVTAAGAYIATFTDSVTGCSSSNSITINRRPPVGLFPHYCDSIPCTCRSNQLGDFTIYAPLPLIGAFAAIYDIQWYFNNNPVGPNGPNPTFTPAVTGSYHIVVTDPITGCADTSETYSIVVPLCNQCDSTTCHVDLGNDTTICAGGVVTLTANGCNGNAIWYALTPNGPVPVGQNPIIDVTPLQSTCYVVQCCDSIPDQINGGFFLCCCTDTICINVNPVPIVSWPLFFPPVCLNSAPVYLDTLLIFVLPAGGTGVFSGPNVTGYYFNPITQGPSTITYCYTDTNGCTTCVSTIINVFFCCDSTSCHVDLGNDTTICGPGIVILTAHGCNGNAKWYQLTPSGPIPIGQDSIMDVFPQQNTCYVAECCCIFGQDTCCTTDTICIIVKPHPILTWPIVYPTVCVNSDSIYLDTLSIIAIPPGGTGVFSGTGVVGNYFYPDSIGTFTITYCYTDPNGCMACVSNTINVVRCGCVDTCLNFSDGNLIGWQADPSAPNVAVTISNVLSIGGPFDYYIHTANQAGPSQLFAGDQFKGQWCCGTFCYDYRLFDDGETFPVTINPAFTILSGTLGFQFTSSTFVSENDSAWWTICAPVSDCDFNDTSTLGIWAPITGTNISDWFTVINNVTGIVFKIDYNLSSGEVSGFDNFCLKPGIPDVEAGPDQVVCQGFPGDIQIEACSVWQMLVITPTGNIPYFTGTSAQYGNGEGLASSYVVPTDTTTCFLIICCNEGSTCCCDTDTICIYVNAPPVVIWNQNFPNVCLNSSPIYLDTLLVNVTPPGGVITFSGPFVAGNYFSPIAPGTWNISCCYTDTNGCTTCVVKSINVAFCCDTSQCHVTLGNDTAICEGSIVILNAQGCNGTVKWYKLNPDGPELINQQGPMLDILPLQSTCYVVECCCIIGQDTCCMTDTICITVYPHPILVWPTFYPTVCLYSDSIYLDTLNIVALPPGGTGIFSGIGVVGNYFHPDSIGTFTILYCYTDKNGCNACVSNTINVTFCCDTSQCHVYLGNDTSICGPGVVILNAHGCNGNVKWYQLTPSGPIPIGQDSIMDVFPQQNTCYVAECCCIIGQDTCCTSDTICIIVKPHPILTWPVVYPTVCVNSDSIYLDTLNIIALPPGGSGVFSGPGVTGNYFYPTTLGPHTITYCYTDLNGCTTCINNTINVIFCCDSSSCHVDAGNDTTICAGSSVVLNAQGCSGSHTWYALTVEGPVVIGQEPEIAVNPIQTTCYMVVCCCLHPIYQVMCCDTDTICVNVKPVPHLDWTWQYGNVCLNSDSILLDPNNIFVTINNAQVPITLTTGTWVWLGAGVVGNYFHPDSIGIHVITLCYTAPNGCTTCITNTINVIDCSCPGLCNCASLPPPPLPTITIVSVSGDNCFNDGCINVTFTGCCLKYNYTYYNPCNPLLSFSTAPDTNPNIFCNLPAGLYTIYVTDGCGNSVQQNVTIPFNGQPLGATVSFTNCADSVCVAGVGGCAPYTYQWSNGSTSSCIAVLEHCTSIVVTITDRRGCTFTKVVWVPGVQFNAIQPNCCVPNSGSLCVSVCAGPHEYTYVWSNQQTGPCINGLAPGVYCVTITDETGNQFNCCYTLTANITSPFVSFNFNNCGNSVTAVIGQSNCPYTFYWDNNSTELLRNNLTACDSLTFTIVTCNQVFHHGFRVPALFPTITPVNCATGLGMICVPINCFRCPPYSYSWSPMPINASAIGNCLIAPPGNYTVCITNACGDVVCCPVYLPPPVIPCDIIVHIDILIEGFYTFGGMMRPVFLNSGLSSDSSLCDLISVEIHEAAMPYNLVAGSTTILKVDGTADVQFPGYLLNNDYYIVVKHRNAIETWSKLPVHFGSQNVNYDFKH